VIGRAKPTSRDAPTICGIFFFLFRVGRRGPLSFGEWSSSSPTTAARAASRATTRLAALAKKGDDDE
jgi:hypothetical protein